LRENRRNYRFRAEARADVFEYIEMFHDPRRRHNHLGDVSLEAFESAGPEPLKRVHLD